MSSSDEEKLSGESELAGDSDTTDAGASESAPTPSAPAADAVVENSAPAYAAPAPVAAGGAEDAEGGDEADGDSEPDLESPGEDAAEDLDLDDEDEDEVGEPAGPAVAEKRRRRRLRRGATERDAAKGKKDESRKPVPAPRRRRTTRKPGEPVPVVRAQAKYVRSSARKARLVCDHIRGKSVEDARAILAHTPRAVARDWSKLLESAVANAEHNHELVGEDLYVKVVQADEGPTIKRHRPRAQGRATKIRKRTTHLTILLTPKDE
jgi:ribosomal protein L22